MRKPVAGLVGGLLLLTGCGTPSTPLLDDVVATPYPGGLHTTNDVTYAEDPPVGGPHDPQWADCTGTVYTVPIRAENAVHSLEHGAVWITYNPEQLSDGDLELLTGMVTGQPATMLSPVPGQDALVSLQAWGHQLKVDQVDTDQVEVFASRYRLDPDNAPEPGASCEMPDFLDNPLQPSDPSRYA